MHGACQSCGVQIHVNILHRQGNPYGQNIVVFVIDVYREVTSMFIPFSESYRNEIRVS
jgi:hypothetical protein